MNHSVSRSTLLSQICVVLFAVCLAALDIGCYWAVGFFIRLRNMPWQTGIFMMITLYLCSVFGWILLVRLWSLLKNIRAGEVFTERNVRSLHAVSCCCVGAFVILLVSAIYYIPFLFVSMAAGFMALLVHIIQNIFHQAVAMKDDLDLTI